MAEGRLWDCDSEFPDRRELVFAYSGQINVRPVLQEERASIYEHGSRMECVDIPHLLDECGGICIGSRRANLQLSDWDCGESVRELVYVWARGCVLAI